MGAQWLKGMPRLQKAAERLQKEKRLKPVILLLAVGLFALILSFGTTKQSEKSAEPELPSAGGFYTVDQLEDRLTALVSSIEGVGRVRVMVTLENDGERVYLRDRESELLSDPSGRASVDRKEDSVIIKNGSSEQGILIKTAEPKIRGVAVVCDGGDDPAVRTRIVDTVTALFSVSSARVSVEKMSDKNE